jgi:tRNA threonylcarbamoyladenosine biosynthesis protein TsaB
MPADFDNLVALAIETSGRVGSVVVARGPTIVVSGSFSTLHQHGVELLPTVDRLCREAGVEPADIAHVYASGGPGSFTGVRIALTFAKALSMARGAAVVRVPSLEVIAQNALELPSRPARVAVVLDAKRSHVYTAHFDLQDGCYVPRDEPAERDPAEYLAELGPVGVLGEGVALHAAAIARCPNAVVLPSELNAAQAVTVHLIGRRMAQNGQFCDLDALVPVYIRQAEAEEKWAARHGR